MIDFQNWTNQRNFDRERLSLKRQYNQQVEYFQNNPAEVARFEQLVSMHEKLPIRETFDAYYAGIPAGSKSLFDIEDAITDERIIKETELYETIYDKYTPENLEKHMGLNILDVISNGWLPGGAKPGDAQWGVWAFLGIDWALQTWGPSGKNNVLGRIGNKIFPGQPFHKGRMIEYGAALRQADEWMEQGMSFDEAQSKLMINISETEIEDLGQDLGFWGEVKQDWRIRREAEMMAGQTNLGGLWDEVAANGVLSKEHKWFGLNFGQVDEPVNFDRSSWIGFYPIKGTETEMYAELRNAQVPHDIALETVYNTIGKPIKAPDENGQIFYQTLNRPNKINFYAGRFTNNRIYSADSDSRHQAWESDNILLEYSPGKIYASEIYEPGTQAFHYLSGTIDIIHQAADLALGGLAKKGASLSSRWNNVNRATKFLDEGVLVKNTTKTYPFQRSVTLNKEKIIENVYDLANLSLADETTRNTSRLMKLFNGNNILSEAKEVRKAVKAAKKARNDALVFGRVNKIFLPAVDDILNTPVMKTITQLVAETPIDKISTVAKMPLFGNFAPEALQKMLKMNKSGDVLNFIKEYIETGIKIVKPVKTKEGKLVEIDRMHKLDSLQGIGQSGIINATMRYAAEQAAKAGNSKRVSERVKGSLWGLIGNQDAAYRNLGSYIGQGVRGVQKTVGSIIPKRKSINKTNLDNIEALPKDAADDGFNLYQKLKNNFTDYGEYEIQKYLGFSGASRTFNEPYFRGMLELIPDYGIPLFNKHGAWKQILAHTNINKYTEARASKLLNDFLSLDYSNKQAVREFGRRIADEDVKFIEDIVGPERAAFLSKWVIDKFKALDRSVAYAQGRGGNLPYPGSKFEVWKTNMSGKMANVPIANAFLLSQMADNYVPLIPYKYIQKFARGVWNFVPSKGSSIYGNITGDAKAFGQWLKNWGDDAFLNPYTNYKIRPKKIEDAAVTMALDFYTRKVFKPLVLIRFAFLTRVFMEEQARMLVGGLSNIYNDPKTYLAWLGGRKPGSKLPDKKLLDLGYTQKQIDDFPELQSLVMQEEYLNAIQSTGLWGVAKGQRWNPATTEYTAFPKGHEIVPNRLYTEQKLWDYSQVITDPIASKVALWGWNSPELNKWLKSTEGMDARRLLSDKTSDTKYWSDADYYDQYIQSIEGWIRSITGDEILEGTHYFKRGNTDTHRWDLSKTISKGNEELRDILRNKEIINLDTGKSVRFFNDKKIMTKRDREKAIDTAFKYFDDADGGLNINAGDVRISNDIVDGVEKGTLQKFDEGLDAFTGAIFDFLMRKPIAYLNRSPVFKQYYWAWVTENIGNMSPSLQKRYIDDAIVYKVPKKVVDELKASAALQGSTKDGWDIFSEIDVMARAFALSNVKELLYETTRRHKISDATRNIFPFAEVWFEVFQTWGRLLAKNPYPIRGGQLATRGLRNTVDVTYNRLGYFAPDSRNPDNETYITPWGSWMGKLVIEDENENLSMQFRSNVTSVNLLASNQVPGVNPFVGFGLDFVLPRHGIGAEIRDFISNFPLPDEWDEIFPEASSYKKLFAFLKGIDVDLTGVWDEDVDVLNVFEFSDEIEREANGALSDVNKMRADATINHYRFMKVSGEWAKVYANGSLDKYLKRDVPNWIKGEETAKQIEDAVMNYARDKSQVIFLLQFISEWIGPSNYKPEYFIKAKDGRHYGIATLYEVYQKILEDNNYNVVQTAQDFTSKFGFDHSYILSPTDAKIAGQTPNTSRTVSFWNEPENKKVRKQLPLSYYFLNPDNKYEQRTWQEVQNGRWDLTPDEYRRYINNTQGYYLTQGNSQMIDSLNEILKQKNTGMSTSETSLLKSLFNTWTRTSLEGFQADEYGIPSGPDTKDIWNEILEEPGWENVDLASELPAGKFILELLPIIRDYNKQSGEYTLKTQNKIDGDWWMKSDNPLAVKLRMDFDSEAKELLMKYPEGFILYSRVIVRLMNPDYTAYSNMNIEYDDIMDYPIIQGEDR